MSGTTSAWPWSDLREEKSWGLVVLSAFLNLSVQTGGVSFTLRRDVGAAALRHQVVLQLLDLLPVLLQLHLKLLNQAAEVASHRQGQIKTLTETMMQINFIFIPATTL